jgi:hypothetical protein
LPTAGDEDVGTLSRQTLRGSQPYPSAATGHDGSFAFERSHVRPLPYSVSIGTEVP